MQRIVVLLLGFVNILVQYYDVPSLKLGHYSNLIWMKKIEKICYSISNTNSNVQYSNIVWKFEFKIQIQIRNSIKNSKLFENNQSRVARFKKWKKPNFATSFLIHKG